MAAGAFMGAALIAGCSGGNAPAAGNNSTEAVVEDESGPAYALITQPLGKVAPVDYSQQLAAARAAGEISDVVLVKSKPSPEGPLGFDSLAVVTFPSADAYAKWSTNTAPKLGADLIVRRADLLVDARAGSRDAKTAYVVNHYEALIPPADYAEFTKAYISPNMDGQKKAGVMTGYAMYYEREPVPGTKGNRAVLVKQFVDEAAFLGSAKLKAGIKEELMKNAEWKRINDTKDSLRKDISSTLALPTEVK
jgi:hypothetical protein